jgi:hypothetical protein
MESVGKHDRPHPMQERNMKTRIAYLAFWVVTASMAPGCGKSNEPAAEAQPEVQVAAAVVDPAKADVLDKEEAGEGDGSIVDEMDATTLGKGGSAHSGGGGAPGRSAPKGGAAPKSAPKAGSGAPGKGGPKTGGTAKSTPKTGGAAQAAPKTGGTGKATPKTGTASKDPRTGAPGVAIPNTGGTPSANSAPTTGTPGAGAGNKGGPGSTSTVFSMRPWTPPTYRYWGSYFYYNTAWFFEWVYDNSGPDDAGTVPDSTSDKIQSKVAPKKDAASDADDLIKDLERLSQDKKKDAPRKP